MRTRQTLAITWKGIPTYNTQEEVDSRVADLKRRIPEQVAKAIGESKGSEKLVGELTLELSPEIPLLNVPLAVFLTVPVEIAARNEWQGLAGYIAESIAREFDNSSRPGLLRTSTYTAVD